MTLNVVGEIASDALLQPDWHKNLNDTQLAAYIRYQFIWRKENVLDWDSPAHSRRRQNWDGGKNSFGVNFTSRWAEARKIIRDHDAHPGMWVHAQFSPAAD